MRARKLVIYAAVIFFALLSGLPLPAQATELTGFGPIKFGMTKEEAWAAIDGKGKWEYEGRQLVYEYPIHDRTGLFGALKVKNFKVIQTFHDDVASDVFVYISSNLDHLGSCARETSYFIAAVQHKYGKPALVMEHVADKIGRQDAEYAMTTSLYVFPFDDEALIRIALESWDAGDLDGGCHLEIWYHPPVPKPIPF